MLGGALRICCDKVSYCEVEITDLAYLIFYVGRCDR